jgi:hypothetical protein
MAKDMCSNSGSTTAVAAMYQNTVLIESNVEAIVKVAFPDKYQDMKAITDAGKIWQRPSGCHVARAVVFKLPVLPHWDDTDFETSVSFAAGRFKRGFLYIPQFGVAFEWVFILFIFIYFLFHLIAFYRYSPGSAAAFYADRIIHCVGDWESVRMEKNDETTPGRIGTVFYIPHSSAEALRGKEAGWGLKTNFGRFPVA